MMAKFYLVQEMWDNILPGYLVKVENQKLYLIDLNKNFKFTNFRIPTNLIELTAIKMEYLKRFTINKRLYINEKQVIEKFMKLKPKDECIITTNETRFRCSVERIKDTELHLMKMDGKEKIISIFKIDNIENETYYLCMSTSVEGGMIIKDCDGIAKLYPEGDVPKNVGDVENISGDEARFLNKYPREDRQKMHSDKIWENITKLSINSYCYIATDPDRSLFRILEKSRTSDGVIFLLTKVRTNKQMRVKESEVRAVTLPLGGSSSTSLTSIRGAQSINRQISLDSKKGILCTDNNVVIINTSNIDKTETEENYNKIISLRQGSSSLLVTLKWKGKVNGKMCIGCELSKDSKHGTEGTFHGERLFQCIDNRGVLIEVDESVRCCETDNGRVSSQGKKHNDINYVKDVIIAERCICCAEARDVLPTAQHIKCGNIIILMNNCLGRIKWTGLINGEECVGVETFDLQTDINAPFTGLPLFSSRPGYGCVVKVQDIPQRIWCEQIQHHIINPSNLNLIEKSEPIYKYMMLCGKEKLKYLEVMWQGSIDGRECVGLALKSDFTYGTKGNFCGQKLFGCEPRRGILVEINELTTKCRSDSKMHKSLPPETFINVESICCIEPVYRLALIPEIIVGSTIFIKNNKNKSPRKCLWIGKVNGIECVGLAVNFSNAPKSDGVFNTIKLFDCENGKGVLCQLENVEIVPTLKLVREMYLRNDQKFTYSERREQPNKNNLMKILDDPPLYGWTLFTIYEEYFTAIKIKFDCTRENSEWLKDIMFENGNVRFLLVLSSRVELFNEPLLEDGNVIVQESIKMMESWKSEVFKEKDIVTYKSGEEILYGEVQHMARINGIPCLGIVRTFGNDDKMEIFIRESVALKLDNENFVSKFIKGVIYQPQSIVTFTEYNMDRLGRNDEVEFQLRGELEMYKGKVLLTSMANNEPCAVVELCTALKKVDMNACTIERYTAFKDICKSEANKIVIISTCVLRVTDKKILKCGTNNVFVLDPNKVGSWKELSKEKRTIIFKSNGEAIITELRCIGCIDNEIFLGCEMSRKSKYGTDGTFDDEALFQSDEGCGVLIPLNKIDDCCVKPPNTNVFSSFISKIYSGHTQLRENQDGSIIGASICCVQTLEILVKNSKLIVNKQVMHKNKSVKVFGMCRWIGLVNMNEVIGVDIVHCGVSNQDELIYKLPLFRHATNNLQLFLAENFVIDPTGLCYCPKNDVVIVDPNTIMRVENGDVVKTKIVFGSPGNILNIKWRGVINGALCVGCELTSECECRTDGVFGDLMLFECAAHRGVLIPSDYLSDSCESIGKHKDIGRYPSGGVNPTSICCFDEKEDLTKWKPMAINSKIKVKTGLFGSEKFGECKWLGLVNGKKSVGVKMTSDLSNGTNGRFQLVDLFACKDGGAMLYLVQDVELSKEKLCFFVDKNFKLTEISKIKDKTDDIGLTIGDYVSAKIMNDADALKTYFGEVKWKGLVNKNRSVGIDLEVPCHNGHDGIVFGNQKFECKLGHGIVIVVDNVHRIDTPDLPMTIDGVVNPKKYLRFVSKWNMEYLHTRNVSKDGLVSVKIDNDRGGLTMNGNLRWSGYMNGQDVAVVELNQDYENGTDGTFWRQSLIKCSDKRAIAVPWANIYRYTPFKELRIPRDNRLFKDLDVNSAVIYYIKRSDVLVPFYGTIKWSGMNAFDQFVYGIDLDDRTNEGTDGKFENIRLFHCSDGHGVLALMGEVAPDVRFTETKYEDKDIRVSKKSETIQFATPVKQYRGEDFGIQGNANSCYFDSSIFALFSKSDVLDFMISPMLNTGESVPITKTFREVMARDIVYPLREFGTISFHNTKKMREIIKGYGGKFLEMTKQETDMENVASLLMKLCPENQLLSLRSFSGHINSGMFLQLFVILNKSIPNISSQQMLDLSMAQNEIMFNVPPTCLIMQAPRDARGINCYNNVLPSKTIEISNMCYTCYKKCFKCQQMALWQCKICIETTNRMKDALQCADHKCGHREVLSIPQSEIQSKSEMQMTLKAIICIEKAHFVTYVKEDEFKNEWVFFDSMSTQNPANNYAVPKVSFEEEVSHFLSFNEKEMEDELILYETEKLKRIAKDSYIFVYHNTSQTCY